ncbi:MAG TPA: ATP-binding protein, partial [Terriglobales bacterium]|nr:ATP-binding protein [Terriglobales bacterium]
SSLRIRLLGIVLLMALPAVGLVLDSGFRERRLAEARSLTEARGLTDRTCAGIDEALRDSRAFLESLARVPEVQRGNVRACEALFRSILRQRGSAVAERLYAPDGERAAPGKSPYQGIALAKLDGDVIASGVPLTRPVNVRDRRYFRRALATGAFAIGDYQIGRVTGRPGLNVACPVRDRQGKVSGVVFAAIDLAWVSSAPVGTSLPPGAILLVVDGQGTILARYPDGGSWVGRAVADAPAVRAILNRHQGVVRASGPAGIDRLWTFRPVEGAPEGGAFVALGLTPRIVFADADRITREALISLGICTVVAALLISLWAQWFLLRPVDAMVATVRRMRAGDMAARTNPSDSGELGDLGRALDAMAGELQRRHEQLEQAASALRTSNETLEAVLTASPAAIVALDCERRVTLWTSGAERLFGWRSDEMLGQVQPAHIPADQRSASYDLAGRALAGERLIDVPVQRTDREGRTLDLSLSTAPLRDTNGDVSGTVVIYVDTAPRRQLERQLHHAQKMEAIGRLAGGVAHDFNNVLTVIQGFSELVLRRAKLDPASLRNLQEVHKAALRAASLTGQLLAFSRRQPAEPRVVDLNAVVSEMTNMLRRLIGEDVKLETRLTPQPACARVDPGGIEQVIANLAVNARDAMPEGGRLVIETAHRSCALDARRCKASCDGRCVVLTVADSGLGMSAETLPHIFEPFFTTKELDRGTGLGLATAYGILEQCGAQIEVDSELGSGTQFRICFPLAEGVEEPSAEPPSDAQLADGIGTVLLVEDEDAVRALAQATLERRG